MIVLEAIYDNLVEENEYGAYILADDESLVIIDEDIKKR